MVTTIVITKRSSDYHAQIKGEPGLWAAGRSPRCAVGDLIMSHKEYFGIVIKQNSK
jgi:hypothetical protein